MTAVAAWLLVLIVALVLAFRNQDLIFDLVSYAWSGLGASFGPPLLLSLRWKKATAAGAVAGMLAGTVSNIVWKNTPLLNDALDLKLASFAISLIFTLAVSYTTYKPDRTSPV